MELLQSIWFYLWGLLWAVFFMTEGFDFGIGMLYPFLGKDEKDKEIMLHVLGPTWNGNEVWLISAAGVTFAAFPAVYSVMFSSLYCPIMLILFALILRGVSLEFQTHSRVETHSRASLHTIWDGCIFLGSFIPTISFGLIFGNIFKGLELDKNGLINISSIFNPYAIFTSFFFLVLFLNHGALWLSFRTEGEINKKSAKAANILWVIVFIGFILFLVSTKLLTPLYQNFISKPLLHIVVIIPFLSILLIKRFLNKEDFFKAWLCSSVAIIGFTFIGIIGLYPNMMPSVIDPSYTLTAFNSSSSLFTLKIMFGVVALFVPTVISYQIWSYTLFKDKVTKKDLGEFGY
ncbi:MAG: cytochrome d ubiquinol oxidase subunit II [Desulfobacterales bacterium]|nr:cytochrome d ubiquinol oxidase subunit II [Desulfobacterales bacterium]MBF0395309.1 cytochrome d ubiquinol oxidase subunit II [Desulfobacterales bacterium]